MAGFTEADAGSSSCPCNTGSTVHVVPFIGDNYTSVSQAIMLVAGAVSSTHLIHSEMVKVVVLLKHLVVLLLVSHGFTETMVLLTILS